MTQLLIFIQATHVLQTTHRMWTYFLILVIISHLSPNILRLSQLRETKNILILVLSDYRGLGNTAGEQISQETVLKQVRHKLNEDTTAEVKYFMSSVVVTRPVSKATVESWGSYLCSIKKHGGI